MLLRFEEGRLIPAVATALLVRCSDGLAGEEVTGLALIGEKYILVHQPGGLDIAVHLSRDDQADQPGCGVVSCGLPAKGPCLSPIEPDWVHDKRAVSALDRRLSTAELYGRVCARQTPGLTAAFTRKAVHLITEQGYTVAEAARHTRLQALSGDVNPHAYELSAKVV